MICQYHTTTGQCEKDATHRVVAHALEPGRWSTLEGAAPLCRLDGWEVPYPDEPGLPKGPIIMQPEFCLVHAMEVMDSRMKHWRAAAYAKLPQAA